MSACAESRADYHIAGSENWLSRNASDSTCREPITASATLSGRPPTRHWDNTYPLYLLTVRTAGADTSTDAATRPETRAVKRWSESATRCCEQWTANANRFLTGAALIRRSPDQARLWWDTDREHGFVGFFSSGGIPMD